MAIKIGLLERVNLEVAALVYQQLEVANLAYVKLEVGTLTYSDPEMTNVFLDPDTKNRILHDLASVSEDYFAHISLAKHESLSAPDTYALALNKAVGEVIGVIEASVLDIRKPLLDGSVVTDIFRLALHKVFADNTFLSDVFDVTTIKAFNDSVASSDTFDLVASYVRHFQDYVALDDFAGIDKFYNGTKHNIVGTVDHTTLALSILKADTMSTVDMLNHINTDKALSDTVMFADSLRKVMIHVLVDAPLVTETVRSILIKPLSDATGELADQVALSNTLNKSDATSVLTLLKKSIISKIIDSAVTVDQVAKTMHKFFTDAVAVDDAFGFMDQATLHKGNVTVISDLLSIQSSKEATDVAIVSDAFNVSYVPGNLMLFNNIPFNESTFG